MNLTARTIYRKLFRSFGPQHWWPGDSPFEVIVGAILTQGTNWGNVEKAIANLKRARVLEPHAMSALARARLAALIRPAGYFNVKADRLKAFLRYFTGRYGGSAARMAREDAAKLRGELLAVKGIGPETADSILLYALGKPVFVVDAYTKRMLVRHNLARPGVSYDDARRFFTGAARGACVGGAETFNEYHALIVRLAKTYCLKRSPDCPACPLNDGKRRRHDAQVV